MGKPRGRCAPQLASFEKRLATGDRTDEEVLRRYDWEFHNALISACGSQLLLDMHASIYDKYLRYLMLAAVFRGAPMYGSTNSSSRTCSPATGAPRRRSP